MIPKGFRCGAGFRNRPTTCGPLHNRAARAKFSELPPSCPVENTTRPTLAPVWTGVSDQFPLSEPVGIRLRKLMGAALRTAPVPPVEHPSIDRQHVHLASATDAATDSGCVANLTEAVPELPWISQWNTWRWYVGNFHHDYTPRPAAACLKPSAVAMEPLRNAQWSARPPARPPAPLYHIRWPSIVRRIIPLLRKSIYGPHK